MINISVSKTCLTFLKVTLASLSCSVVFPSLVVAQDNTQAEWSDRSSVEQLSSLSLSDSGDRLDFELTELPDLNANLSTEDLSSSAATQEPLQASSIPTTTIAQREDSPTDTSTEQRDRKWFFTIYGGTGTNSSLGQTLTGKRSEFYDSFFNSENYLGLEIGRKIASLSKDLQIEVTGQARQHFNDADYLALETALVLRWHIARNSNFLNASLAVGDGLSYATDLPQVEADRPSSFKKSNLLNYVLIETALSLPKNPDWSLVLRLNHRSGVFGIFNGARDGSNNVSVGIRHSF